MHRIDFEELNNKIAKSNENEYLGKDKPVNKIEPLVSVTVLTYQHAPYIKDCLDGILMQETDFPFEVIIGEDESDDGTREICKEYAEKYPDRIRLLLRSRKDLIYIANSPTGRFNGMANTKASCGKYIAICEGDDYWTDSHKLQKQVDYMENNPECTMCTHAAIVIDVHDDKIKEIRPNIGNATFTVEDVMPGGGFSVATASMVYPRSFADDRPSWLLNAPTGDFPTRMFCATQGYIGYIDEFMSVYRSGTPFSWTSNKRKNKNLIITKNLKFIDMFNEYNHYTNKKYDAKIQQINLKYLKNTINLADKKFITSTTQYKAVVNKLPFKDRIAIKLQVFMPLAYKVLEYVRRGIRKVVRRILG